ncbi:hypothetical protein [Mesorhizobium sp. Pch-S]|uniref:hypothetical protein n=1 Tax=Mesorhizobium sp. Pch-S TaxID=2082387 RepID=UPI001010F033|nr:hypothetical protein [Mesorhizobium sp. Pch-S]QAZ45930.1 hypothetical protein C1M53_26455 [Mesorhizobium sp. Pch-S]
MGLILDFFTRNFPDDDIDAGFEAEVEKHLTAFHPKCEPTMLDKAATIVTDTLEHAHTLKVRLEREIAEKQELLRQANVVIEVFGPNLIKLEERVDPPVAIASRAKRGKPQLAAAE